MYEPDPRTVRAAARGGVAAFEELMHGYQAQVWRFLSHLLGDAALAEDVTQETFLRVHGRLRQFRFRSRFSTWVFAIARNAGIDALRARERRARLVESLPSGQPSVDPAVAVEVTEGVASLPPLLREALLLVEVLGFTYREAGEAVGVPEGTVKSRVFRARQELVAWLTAEDGTEAGHAL